MLTYFLHLNDESIDVVSGIVVVQILLMVLYLLIHEVFETVIMAEDFIVRTWQVLHHRRKRLIQLKQSTNANSPSELHFPHRSISLNDYLVSRQTDLTPRRTLQHKKFREIIQQHLEFVITVLKASPHHQLADDVGHGPGEEAGWVEGFT